MTERSTSVALFLTSFRGGGAEKAMVKLANGLSSKGFNVELLVGDSEGPNRKAVYETIKTTEWNRGSVSRCLPHLRRYLAKSEPDVLITTGLHACVIVAIAHFFTRSSTKIVAREALPISIELEQGRLLKTLCRFFYPRFHAMVSMTHCQADDRRSVIRQKMTTLEVVIPNSVDWDKVDLLRSQPLHPSLPPSFEGQAFILSMGRLIEQKQFDLLLKAFAEIKDRISHNLIILGEGRLRDSLANQCEVLGLTDRVWLPGYAENPYAFLEHADMYVLCSKFEGMPNGLIDAVAMGTSAVATDCRCGPSEVLEGIEYSTLIPVGDIDSLAREIEQHALLNENPNENPTSQKSHPVPEHWCKKFSEDNVISSYVAMIDELCGASRSPTKWVKA